MTEYRTGLPERPARIAKLPLNDAGYPIPWFVDYIDGKPDFRVMDGEKLVLAIKLGLCWTCGKPLGAFRTFVIGPMCAVNRVSAEPPSHTECAVYSATACPFLTNPKKRRREGGLPEDRTSAGIMIPRNPGVALVWTTKKYRMFRDGPGVLFNIGDPIEIRWYAEGREATRAEVLASIDSGLPLLLAEAEAEGSKAVAALGEMHAKVMRLVPA